MKKLTTSTKPGDSLRSGLIISLLLFNSCRNNVAPASGNPDSLPVYEVVEPAPAKALVNNLTTKLKLSSAGFVSQNGPISFEDTSSNLKIPTLPVNNPTTQQLLKSNSGEASDASVKYEAIDFYSLKKVAVPDSAAATKLARESFSSAGFHLDNTKATVSHTIFSVSYKDTSGRTVAINQPLDTRVNYQFFDKSCYSFTGPGARMNMTVTTGNKISQLYYAWRELKEGPQVKLLTEGEARERITKLLPKGAEISMKIVYWCPPLTGTNNVAAPKFIIPWFSFKGTFNRKSANGKVYKVTTKEGLIPATADPRFIPKVSINVRGQGTSRIAASASVTGGQRPYKYTWIGSDPSLASRNANDISYQPIARDLNGAKAKNEFLSLIVTDANGVTLLASQSISVIPVIVGLPRPGKHTEAATYGCESPGEPEIWSQERIGWQQGMANTGGGTEKFCWLGDNSWPGDYIKPTPAGSQPASPWINGDADYANWGVNTASLVLVNGDGWPDGFTAMYPNAPQSDYNTKVNLYRPTNPGATIVLPIPTDPTYYNIPYKGSWGPVGPNDHLYWLVGLLCECLNPTDDQGLTPAERWGPAFGGLHIFTGFASDAAYSAGAFPKAFAENILGVNGPAQTIKNAWFNACTTTNEGVAAAMGPITTGGVSDINDYYIGKGSRGPTITGAAITGFWYLHQ